MHITEDNPLVKISTCRHCDNIVRIGVWSKMDLSAKNKFSIEVNKYDLAVIELPLTEYQLKYSDKQFCKCK